MARDVHQVTVLIMGLLGAFLLALLLGGCGQRDPTQAPVGDIFVSSNIPGATIFLDGANTQQVTPDTLVGIPIGIHVVSVSLEGFVSSPAWREVSVSIGQLAEVDFLLSGRRIALLEHFTWVYCQPCPAINNLINGLLRDLGSEQVVGIEYHPFEPDPFYEAAPTENVARKNYYDVTSVPALFVDGQEPSGTIDSLALVSAVEARLAETPVVGVAVSDTVVGQSWSGTAEIIGYADVVASDVRGFFVVMEREVHYSQPPGSNGEKDFHYVMRTILPDADGDVLQISAGDTLTRFGQFDIHPESNPAQIYSVYFVQNRLSREVLQAGTSLSE